MQRIGEPPCPSISKGSCDAPTRSDGTGCWWTAFGCTAFREALQLDPWATDAAPSTGLRKWFDHDRANLHGFKARYFRELRKNIERCTTK
ncbi:MAG: DUF488 family protein [Gammaproteobacteria bacterium]